MKRDSLRPRCTKGESVKREREREREMEGVRERDKVCERETRGAPIYACSERRYHVRALYLTHTHPPSLSHPLCISQETLPCTGACAHGSERKNERASRRERARASEMEWKLAREGGKEGGERGGGSARENAREVVYVCESG